jgi:RNA polymerase sigma-70 factor (ECF subfamily)
MTGRAAPSHWSQRFDNDLVEQHVDAILAYAFRLTGKYDMAEDLTQQTFLIAQRHVGRLRDWNRMRPWLERILRNTFLQSSRKRWPKSASQIDMKMHELIQPEEDVRWWTEEEPVQQALDQLPEPFRVVVLMYYFEELSYRQIAAELEIPMGTVMSRLSRAKFLLRQALAAPEQLRS